MKPGHYPAVADALLPAIKDVLGDAVDDTVLNAWGEAYWFLAEVLKDRETRSEEHTSELQSLMRISYAVFCLKKKKHIYHKQLNSTKHHLLHTSQTNTTNNNNYMSHDAH